jgi:hypothetical protein
MMNFGYGTLYLHGSGQQVLASEEPSYGKEMNWLSCSLRRRLIMVLIN